MELETGKGELETGNGQLELPIEDSGQCIVCDVFHPAIQTMVSNIV